MSDTGSLAIAGVLLVAAGLGAVLLIRTVRRGWSRLLGRPATDPPSRRPPPRRN